MKYRINQRSEVRGRRPEAGGQRSEARGQRGVALVITLIMLSVITFMAVTFLVLSQREKSSVTTTTDQTIARLANDAGLERAKVEILAPIIAYTNHQKFDLMVSTNFINGRGFQSGLVSPLNVNYDHLFNSPNPLTPNDALQNLANLLYSPRPPVVFPSNSVIPIPQFRFWLDLNRNGRFDTNGFLPVISPNPSFPFYDTNGNLVAAFNPNVRHRFFVGDPEWIGVLEFPERPHGPNNRFVSRYAYIVVPVGRTLDWNYIHNQAWTRALNAANDGFIRNQGTGPWELNLAAFLTDLNTNQWAPPGNPYFYRRPGGLQNSGIAFEDSLSILAYRYGYNYNTLYPANVLFPAAGISAAFGAGGSPVQIDQYVDGPLMVGPANPSNTEATGLPWVGADNTNHFFTTQDLFDPLKTSPGFVGRLTQAGTGFSSYDRYTFYEMTRQIGTETEPDRKMNLNFSNIVNGVVIPGAETNLVAWRPDDFFTNAAHRLLTQLNLRDNNGNLITVTNIPIYPATNNNFYTPAVHHALQLAANLYDATTNRFDGGLGQAPPYLPSVFRPILRRAGTNVFIAGFREVKDASIAFAGTAPQMVDLDDPTDRNNIPPAGTSFAPSDANEPLAYGVPLVLGAKKGLPSFNEVAMETQVPVSRKLQFVRDPGNTSGLFKGVTNQMYVLSISNLFGLEAWNSYTNPYPRNLQLITVADVTVMVTNEVNSTVIFSNRFTYPNVTNIPPNTWAGFINPQMAAQPSLKVPIITNKSYLPESAWDNAPPRGFLPLTGVFQQGEGFPVPQWWLNVSARVRYILVDMQLNRIVDYVNLSHGVSAVDISGVLRENGACKEELSAAPEDQWCTNRYQGSSSLFAPTWGIRNQMAVCLSNINLAGINWNNYSMDPAAGLDRGKAIDGFRKNMGFGVRFYPDTYFRSNTFYAPFNPVRTVYIHSTWQVNDPLVHYTPGDLAASNRLDTLRENPPLPNLGSVNRRYEPWGGNPSASSTSPTKFELALKDPLVKRSDDWDFPTNKLPNIGNIGRVHRGTPWQTIYLKSPDILKTDTNVWRKWSGDFLTVGTNRVYDADLMRPITDQALFDLFTTAINENAQRGQLSVNQSALAAWSAVLSGVIVLTNDIPDTDLASNPYQAPRFNSQLPLPIIQPAGIYADYPAVPSNALPALVRIVNAINDVRATNFIGGTFTNAGNILSVPELSVRSPFLNVANVNQLQYGLTDAAYERIPQQIMSLVTLNHSPRFVVYSYGQTLHPAARSTIPSGTFAGMCTNYQPTAEYATRAVVRLEGSSDPANANHPDPLRRYPPRVVVEQFNVLPPD